MATRLTPAARVNRVLIGYLPSKSSVGARAKLRAAFWSGANVGAVASRMGIADWRAEGIAADLRALRIPRAEENPSRRRTRAGKAPKRKAANPKKRARPLREGERVYHCRRKCR